jgi:hypothetical protein
MLKRERVQAESPRQRFLLGLPAFVGKPLEEHEGAVLEMGFARCPVR